MYYNNNTNLQYYLFVMPEAHTCPIHMGVYGIMNGQATLVQRFKDRLPVTLTFLLFSFHYKKKYYKMSS